MAQQMLDLTSTPDKGQRAAEIDQALREKGWVYLRFPSGEVVKLKQNRTTVRVTKVTERDTLPLQMGEGAGSP